MKDFDKEGLVEGLRKVEKILTEILEK